MANNPASLPSPEALAGWPSFCHLLPSGQTWLTDSWTGGEVRPGPQFSPEAQVQAVVGCHFHRLIGGAYDVGAVGKEEKRREPRSNTRLLPPGGLSWAPSFPGDGPVSSLPFVVLAGEGPIDQLADGACFTQVVQQDHQGDVPSPCAAVYLVGQVGEVQLQVLK